MPSLPRPVAVVDIGSNSVFLFVVQPLVTGGFKELARHKIVARLGAEVAGTGALRAATIKQLSDELAQFKAVADAWDAEINAVATAATRRAANGAEFLAKVRANAQLDVRLLSGEQEAAVAFRGARAGGAARGRPMLCVDVGGGSTELAWGTGNTAELTASVPLGAVSLTRAYFSSEQVDSTALAALKSHVRGEFSRVIEPFTRLSFVAVATSGTITRVARITRDAPSATAEVDGESVSADCVADLVATLAEAPSHDARRALPGMDPARADVLLAGAVIFEELARCLHVSRWQVSASGLRAGLVAETLERRS